MRRGWPCRMALAECRCSQPPSHQLSLGTEHPAPQLTMLGQNQPLRASQHSQEATRSMALACPGRREGRKPGWRAHRGNGLVVELKDQEELGFIFQVWDVARGQGALIPSGTHSPWFSSAVGCPPQCAPLHQ
ncbi:uncharacterized protein ACIB01_016113 [Guaruba guarouba]